MKIAILGYGIEGKSAENYFRKKYSEVEIDIFDQKINSPIVKKVADFKTIDFEAYDMILRSPSVKIKDIKTEYKNKVSSVTRIFFDECKAKIVGVTGTKGKGTTCSLIAEILKAAGRKVWLVGNIGVAALDVIDDVKKEDIVIYELSSFQLWDLQKSPDLAVIVHVEADHLDVHMDMTDYLWAKSNIARWQHAEDSLIYDSSNEFSKQIAGLSPGKKIAYPKGGYELLLNALRIPGKHNRLNGEAAILVCQELGVTDERIIKKGLGAFEGLEHRLKLVGEINGIRFYDDSISTTPGSTIAAIEAFSAPKILILGGSSKGASFKKLAKVIAANKLREIVLIGNSANEIESELKKVGYENIVNLTTKASMLTVVKYTSDIAKKGDVVILSPACASFDMFKSYVDRGDQFIAAVQALSA